MFIGRAEEIKRLKELNWRDQATLVVVYGRRRVGKTALIQEAFKDQIFYQFEGLEGVAPSEQLAHFVNDLDRYLPNAKPKPKDWEGAFDALETLLTGQNLKKSSSLAPVTILIDEFQWLCSMKPQLVALFKSIWDRRLLPHRNLKFILCGSISSFMVEKVLKSKALYGRVDLEIMLKPLTVSEVDQFFEGKRNRLEVLEIYMSLGGIPQYLKELRPKLSWLQNLNEQAFHAHGYFFTEYQRIFVSHFGKSRHCQAIIEYLAKGPATPKEIAHHLELKTGGTLRAFLNDLEGAGFIERYSSLQLKQNSKYPKYRITDEYINFYFKWILPNRDEILTRSLQVYAILNGPAFEQWYGYAFERLCFKHASALAKALGFFGVSYRFGSWYSVTEDRGCQIDLLFERRDRVITICECKWTTKLAGKKLIADFEKKLEVFVAAGASGTSGWGRMAIQKVLVLGKRISVPEQVSAYFDQILFAEDVFF